MSEKVIIYTDGGCHNNGDRVGGIGVVMKYGEHVKEISEGFTDTTNNRMELMACIRGLESLKKKNVPIEIYSDSAYLVNCFNQEWFKKWELANRWRTSSGSPVENKDLWIRLLELVRSFKNVSFLKVKGHSNVELNERADELATTAMKKVRSDEETRKTK